ncbi:MAG: hypothetical protein M1834_005936 [Cirrosporium novae-zelandiae]|nr:MAG: hypothetical protein M1834_005936 [Cirrosporium novae-zelandiae]
MPTGTEAPTSPTAPTAPTAPAASARPIAPAAGDISDNDSSYSSENSLLDEDTVSLTSSIYKYRFENGRRYHAYHDGAYYAPNDEKQNDQLDLTHHLWSLTLDNKLLLAPIKNPQKILDVGTGTGIWAIDVADQFPSAQVIGTDLSPIQPQWIPPNCSFEIDDCNEDWTYQEDSFDFIHVRDMMGTVPDWDEFFRKAYFHTKPGGYIECLEHSVKGVSDEKPLGKDHTISKWGDIALDMGEKMGKSFAIHSKLKEMISKAGFTDVVEVKKKWPFNAWPEDSKLKEIGRWNQLRISQGIEGYALRMLTQVGGVSISRILYSMSSNTKKWSYGEVQAVLGQMRTATRDEKSKAYLDVTIVYARKPDPEPAND